MYRTNHFDPGNFSIFDLGDAQPQVRKVYTGPGADLCAFFLHPVHEHVKECVILVRAGDIHPEQAVDLADLLCRAEHGLVCLIKRREEKLPRSEQDGYGDHAKQAVQR